MVSSNPSKSSPTTPPPPAGVTPQPEAARSPLPWRTRIAAGFAILFGACLLTWALSRLVADGGGGGEAPPEAPAATEEATPGVLVLDAAPWGEVRRILGPEGLPIPLPDQAFTPLALELSPGPYRVEVAGPTGAEVELCERHLSAGATVRCRVTFAELEAVDYFREAGWWR